MCLFSEDMLKVSEFASMAEVQSDLSGLSGELVPTFMNLHSVVGGGGCQVHVFITSMSHLDLAVFAVIHPP